MVKGDTERYPALLDFITSPEILAIACEYLNFMPVLSDLIPPGVRLAESRVDLDPNPSPNPQLSQLYHLDFHDLPLIYVIVLLKDVTANSGPFTFFKVKWLQKNRATSKLWRAQKSLSAQR